MRAALSTALERGAEHVDLTSHPGREAANKLYRRLGFATRETNIYRYESGSVAASLLQPAQTSEPETTSEAVCQNI